MADPLQNAALVASLFRPFNQSVQRYGDQRLGLAVDAQRRQQQESDQAQEMLFRGRINQQNNEAAMQRLQTSERNTDARIVAGDEKQRKGTLQSLRKAIQETYAAYTSAAEATGDTMKLADFGDINTESLEDLQKMLSALSQATSQADAKGLAAVVGGQIADASSKRAEMQARDKAEYRKQNDKFVPLVVQSDASEKFRKKYDAILSAGGSPTEAVKQLLNEKAFASEARAIFDSASAAADQAMQDYFESKGRLSLETAINRQESLATQTLLQRPAAYRYFTTMRGGVPRGTEPSSSPEGGVSQDGESGQSGENATVEGVLGAMGEAAPSGGDTDAGAPDEPPYQYPAYSLFGVGERLPDLVKSKALKGARSVSGFPITLAAKAAVNTGETVDETFGKLGQAALFGSTEGARGPFGQVGEAVGSFLTRNDMTPAALTPLQQQLAQRNAEQEAERQRQIEAINQRMAEIFRQKATNATLPGDSRFMFSSSRNQ